MSFGLPLTIYLFLLSLLNWIQTNTHKFYVSTTSVEFKSETKTIEIISQVFTDDLESVLKLKDKELALDPDSDQERIYVLIANYFKQNLQFSSKGELLDYVFLGKEYKNDIAKCYIELQLAEVPDTIELYNGLFLSLFNDQQNIIHFKNADQRKSYLLHQKKPRISLSMTD